MLIAGIIGHDSKMQTANLINYILSAKGMKVSVADINDIINLKTEKLKVYIKELKANKTDFLLLKVNIAGKFKEILDYINFDVMIYNDKADDIKEINGTDYAASMKAVFSMLDKKGVAIVNADNMEQVKILEGTELYTVTYGFNPKASITTSSVGDDLYKDNFMCCLQRTISSRNGKLIEPQEYRVNVGITDLDAYDVMAAASFAIVNGVDINMPDSIVR